MLYLSLALLLVRHCILKAKCVILCVFFPDNQDFGPIDEELVFNGDTVNGTECFFISVVNDEILEASETFTVIVQSATETAIEFADSVLVLTIVDEDGEPNAYKYC